MEGIEAAILRTVLYADIFNFPMTVEEIHHFLIHDEPVSLAQIHQVLASSALLREILEQHEPYIFYAGRGEIVRVRQAREAASQKLWPQAVRCGQWLARLPFVRMVALTGALAMHNAADDDDDLDYLVITAPGRVWLARGFAVLLVRLARARGVTICPNYVLAETALSQEQRNIFMAHEVAQMVPMFGHDLYQRLRSENAWVSQYLPNARGAFYDEAEWSPHRGWAWLKRAGEFVLSGRLGRRLERWEHQRKLRRFAAEMQKPHSAAQLDETQVKGHFDDHGHPVLRQYYERLRQHGIESQPEALRGD